VKKKILVGMVTSLLLFPIVERSVSLTREEIKIGSKWESLMFDALCIKGKVVVITNLGVDKIYVAPMVLQIVGEEPQPVECE